MAPLCEGAAFVASRCLYRATAGDLANAISAGHLIRELRRSFDELIGGRLDDREVESWRNSIPTVVELLLEAGLAEVQVLVEFKIPITDVRMDLVLVGSHPGNGRMSVV